MSTSLIGTLMLKCIFSFFLIVDAFGYDIFDQAKIKQCEKVKSPAFTHEVTDYSKIEEIWAQQREFDP